MWEEELDTGLIPNAIPDDRKEELNPLHQVIKEGITPGMHLVDEAVEHLFMPFHKVDEGLYGLVRILLAHCAGRHQPKGTSGTSGEKK